ncbi:acyltransferase [Aeromicrobium sp. YIM 150415]|uniref:acyltransferase n=1 Tax=Aeromicrobium sp. YIM 150415 TaxID=2803912 RepID=UPI0019622CEF|nr:acyltransferase [Aeromicrobium sp. YIM 150415]MBM9461931.1 acyltransferase [Aeromicrobium sp. YIM 150415]
MPGDTITLTELAPYQDDHGNVIDYDGPPLTSKILVEFSGRDNVLRVDSTAKIGLLEARFDCNGGTMVIGGGSPSGRLRVAARIGEDASVLIGTGVTSTSRCLISAAEGSTLRIGDDVMLARDCRLRCDDSHPIFDIATSRRVNPAMDVTIGNHVWLGDHAMVLGGATVDDGSVIGAVSLVKGRIPNNCIATGSPARVVRRDIAWERPHLSIDPPYYKPDASTIRKSPYWSPTRPSSDPETGARLRSIRRGRLLSRLLGAFSRRGR